MPKKREPKNIIRNCTFVACPGVPKFIGASDIYLIMPFWRLDKDQCVWVDATGTYNLCMTSDQLKYRFESCLDDCETFMYRFIPGNWFSKRNGFQLC